MPLIALPPLQDAMQIVGLAALLVALCMAPASAFIACSTCPACDCTTTTDCSNIGLFALVCALPVDSVIM